jgi:hypothetical protein
MKIRIGQLVIEDVTADELDGLVRKYGDGTLPTKTKRSAPIARPTQEDVSDPSGDPTHDNALLKALVEGGKVGITAKDVGDLLGKKGKGIRKGLRDWTKRIGLTTDAYEPKRVGTSRGFRIKSALLEVAKSKLS